MRSAWFKHGRRAFACCAAAFVIVSPLAAQLRPASASVASQSTLGVDAPVAGTIADAAGQGTGLRDRLPGTGSTLPANDPNLRLDGSAGTRRITSTNRHPNGQAGVATGEYLAADLSRMDSTGSRDVCLAARVRNIRSVEAFDQSGLYIGSSRTTACRAGGLSTVLFNSARTLFSTNTIDGIGPGTAHVAGPPDGSDLFVTIGRLGGQFLFDANGTERVLGPQPAHLNGVAALNVELFAANPGNTPGEVSTIDRFAAYVNSRVVPELGTFLLLLPGLLLLAAVGVQQRAPAGVPSRTALSEAAA